RLPLSASRKEGDVPVSDIPHIHAMLHPALVLSQSSPFCYYSPEKFPEGRRNRSGGVLDRQARSQRRQRPPVSMFESPARRRRVRLAKGASSHVPCLP